MLGLEGGCGLISDGGWTANFTTAICPNLSTGAWIIFGPTPNEHDLRLSSQARLVPAESRQYVYRLPRNAIISSFSSSGRHFDCA